MLSRRGGVAGRKSGVVGRRESASGIHEVTHSPPEPGDFGKTLAHLDMSDRTPTETSEAPAIVVVDRPGLRHRPMMGGNRPVRSPSHGGTGGRREPSLDRSICYSRVPGGRAAGASGSHGRIRRIALLALYLDELLLALGDEQEPTGCKRAESREARPRCQRRCDPHPHGSQCARILRQRQTSEITTWLQNRTRGRLTIRAHRGCATCEFPDSSDSHSVR